MLAYVNLEERVPKDHPLREACRLSPEFEDSMGRASGSIAESVPASPSTRCAASEPSATGILIRWFLDIPDGA